jgi:hypothetical protein
MELNFDSIQKNAVPVNEQGGAKYPYLVSLALLQAARSLASISRLGVQ